MSSKLKMVVIISIFVCLAVPAALAESITYTYDLMNRLTQVQYNDGTTVTYSYDKMGNRLTEAVDAPAAAAAEKQAQPAAPEGPPLPLRAMPSPAPLK
jgi:YD repeat-containing protein